MLFLKFLIKSFLLSFFLLDLESLFYWLDQFFFMDGSQMADPMTRDNSGGRGLDDDDPDEEKIGGPGNPPPKPWYQRVSADAWAAGILFGLLGIAIGVGIIIGSIADPGQNPQAPVPNPEDAVRPPLAGGSADFDGASGPEGGSGGD